VATSSKGASLSVAAKGVLSLFRCWGTGEPVNDRWWRQHNGDETVERSLYDRLGGTDAITTVVRAVVDRQLKDDSINRKSARTNRDRLIKEFVDQICQATGGRAITPGAT
jgi:hypothetical protein